jgi:hypothetical protein
MFCGWIIFFTGGWSMILASRKLGKIVSFGSARRSQQKILSVFVLFQKANSYKHFWKSIFSKKMKKKQ